MTLHVLVSSTCRPHRGLVPRRGLRILQIGQNSPTRSPSLRSDCLNLFLASLLGPVVASLAPSHGIRCLNAKTVYAPGVSSTLFPGPPQGRFNFRSELTDYTKALHAGHHACGEDGSGSMEQHL